MPGNKRKPPQPKPQHRQAFDSDDVSVASSRKRNRVPKHHQEDDDFVSSKMSQKILREALEQQQEMAKEDGEEEISQLNSDFVPGFAVDEEEEEDDDSDAISEVPTQVGEVEIDPEDERILEAFMKEDAGPQPMLADIIAQKLKEKSTAEVRPKLDQSIIDLYKGVGKLLSRYTAGKVPKAFKHIPSLEIWEDVLLLTDPGNWSACAMYQATRIFASNFGPKKAEIFYNFVLLPRVREDIRKHKRLHDRLYQSLKKALYKPAAFFKGILLPLCQSGTCNLREAVIIGSIIQKVSVPTLHSGVALMKLAEMEYCGTTSYFIKLFLDKKYALPYRVLDAVVAHFMRFQQDPRIMPVIWHQSLLALVQRYKNELTREDKVNLDRLIQHQKHYLVTPEIRRELKNSRSRGEKEDDPMSIASPLSVINNPIEEDRWDFPDVPMEED